MAYKFNGITGKQDRTAFPLVPSSSEPTLVNNGDLGVGSEGGNIYLYWKTNDVQYRKLATLA